MDQKRVTLVISDLHVGDGTAGDDFVDHKHQFANFLAAQASGEAGRNGDIELIINGDFLEFVQVLPEAYTLNSPEYWCSESESLAKFDRILAGHPDVFAALKAFQQPGNRVTIFPGNHDVDLYWPTVQKKFRKQAGDINIELGEDTYYRYGGRLHISHGHLFQSIDPSNVFDHWRDPILALPADADPKRLEMCPGNLFVVRYVNFLEAKYPFADNIYPETDLARILLREDPWSLKSVGWTFLRFVAQYPKAFLSSVGETDIGLQLLNAIQGDAFLRGKIAAVYRDALGEADMTTAKVKERLNSEDAIAVFIEQLLRAGPSWEKWIEVLDLAKPGVLSIGASGGDTLAIRNASSIDVRAECVKIARNKWDVGAQIVVFGHTHLPQTVEDGARRYYNPGSWTRYADDAASLTLEQLKDESRFPYALNCVRVEDTGSDSLLSEMMCIDKFSAAC
jgi:UDP-2,3-diacylglucosamine pyrophosphatase LpxH